MKFSCTSLSGPWGYFLGTWHHRYLSSKATKHLNKVVCLKKNWRNKQQSERCKIMWDGVPIGSGTLAGDLGGRTTYLEDLACTVQVLFFFLIVQKYIYFESLTSTFLPSVSPWQTKKKWRHDSQSQYLTPEWPGTHNKGKKGQAHWKI